MSISTLVRPTEPVIADDAVEPIEWVSSADWQDAVAEALNKAVSVKPCPDFDSPDIIFTPKPLGAPAVTMEDVVALAREAARIVEHRGWVAGCLADSYGRVCTVGAMNVATYGAPHRTPWSLRTTEAEILQHGIRDTCELMLFNWLGGVPVEHWNDGAVGMFHDESRYWLRSPRHSVDVASALRAFADDIEAGKVTI